MLQNNREHLELERIMSEIRKLAAERKKLIAEEKVEVGYVFLSVCGSHWGVDRNSGCSRTFTQVLMFAFVPFNPTL
jgi:hypothetical protein